MPVHRYRYFAPQDAARMGRLQLFAREVVEGVITGLHKSPHRGFSAEFSEHREYAPGDEMRHINWKVVGRTDRYYIKLFEQETNLRATLVLDNSASMRFANKLDYGSRLAACLAYLLSRQQDLAGLCVSDASIRVEIPPASSPAHIDRLFRELETLAPGTQTHLAEHLHGLAERLPRRGLVIIISDFWMDTSELSRALQHLRYRKHQAMLIHLQDKSELTLEGPGFSHRQLTLEDMETAQTIAIEPAEIRDEYLKQVSEHLSAVRKGCLDCSTEYHAIDTATAYDKALMQLLARRR